MNLQRLIKSMIDLCGDISNSGFEIRLANRKLNGETPLRQKIVIYLQVAYQKKLKAIYTMVEDEINTAGNDWDDDFIKNWSREARVSLTARLKHTVGKKPNRQLSIK